LIEFEKGDDKMLNQVILIGKIKNITELSNKKELLLEVDRTFTDNEGVKSDLFVCEVWNCLFNKMVSLCSIGDLVAIRGRVNYEEESFIINVENFLLLNKSNKSILKT
jgi:single-stranded DNA-binding protein